MTASVQKVVVKDVQFCNRRDQVPNGFLRWSTIPLFVGRRDLRRLPRSRLPRSRLPRAVRVLDTLFTSANGRARPHHDARVRRILPVIVPREHDDERSPTTLVRVDYSFIGGGKTAKPGNGANGESKDSGVWGIWL